MKILVAESLWRHHDCRCQQTNVPNTGKSAIARNHNLLDTQHIFNR